MRGRGREGGREGEGEGEGGREGEKESRWLVQHTKELGGVCYSPLLYSLEGLSELVFSEAQTVQYVVYIKW